ncbi:MAG: type II toxin-antitoxin system VapC family toxin [Deltaproteobacteria bacterium]|jgi:predicted nucleic acid-binding protein|nr:type II toxin-antitoxin system VapC family toxin [Deltaproteobacteria bacterium]MBW2536018.1 type II toxin-antitoxin system VapC family toxin [Deltaproteobacteria bacterium]
MRVVVDTNVIAYYLLRTEPHYDEARRFWRQVTEPIAPSLWQAELANAVWGVTRAGILEPAEALLRLRLASRLDVESVANQELWEGALARALAADHPVYDTLFVELAARESAPLCSFDQRLLRAFPKIAHRPKALVTP